jgi:hypothetical protein
MNGKGKNLVTDRLKRCRKMNFSQDAGEQGWNKCVDDGT